MSHAYAIEVVKDAPVVFWRMHEDSGTTADDISGNANDGTYSGSPTLDQAGSLALVVETGEITKAVSFDGSDDKLKLASAAITAYPATIIATLKADAVVNTTDYAVIALADEASDNESVVLSLRGNGSNVRAQCNVRTGGADQIVAGAYDIAVDTFVEVAVRLVSATDREIYVNGVSVGTDTTSTTFPSGLDNTTVGTIEAATPTFHSGEVAEVRLYASDIGERRIRAQYSVGQANQWFERMVLRNDPVIFWRLNEADLSTAADQTVQGFDGTEVGAPTEDQGSDIVDDNEASSASFDGSDDGVKYDGSSDRLTNISAFPVTMGAMLASPVSTTSNTNYGIVGIFNTGDALARIFFGFRTDGSNNLKTQMYISDGTGSSNPIGPTTLTKGQRYFLVMVARSSSDIEIYVNGVSEDTDSPSENFPTINRFAVGYQADSTPLFTAGEIGDSFLVDAELSAAEIYAISKVAFTDSRYARQIHALKPKIYARLNEASGATAADDALGGNDLTITGTVDYEQGTPLSADGTGDSIIFESGEYAEVTGISPLSAYPFSLIQWAKTPASPGASSENNGLSLADASDDDIIHALDVLEDGAGNINPRYTAQANGGAAQSIVGTTNLSTGTWYMLAAVARGAADRELFSNDVTSEGTDTNSVAFESAIDTFSVARVGDSTPTNRPGQMAETVLFEHALSIPEIHALYTISQTLAGQVGGTVSRSGVIDGITDLDASAWWPVLTPTIALDILGDLAADAARHAERAGQIDIEADLVVATSEQLANIVNLIAVMGVLVELRATYVFARNRSRTLTLDVEGDIAALAATFTANRAGAVDAEGDLAADTEFTNDGSTTIPQPDFTNAVIFTMPRRETIVTMPRTANPPRERR